VPIATTSQSPLSLLRMKTFRVGLMAAVLTTSVRAQQVHLAFGYECGDRFALRNESTQPVDVEYGLSGVAERSKLHVDQHQTVQLGSTSDRPVQLWSNGHLVATAVKGKRDCPANKISSSGVVVRPIGPGDYIANVPPPYGYPAQYVYVGGWPYYGYYAPYYPPYYAPVVVPFFGAYGRVGRARFGWWW